MIVRGYEDFKNGTQEILSSGFRKYGSSDHVCRGVRLGIIILHRDAQQRRIGDEEYIEFLKKGIMHPIYLGAHALHPPSLTSLALSVPFSLLLFIIIIITHPPSPLTFSLFSFQFPDNTMTLWLTD